MHIDLQEIIPGRKYQLCTRTVSGVCRDLQSGDYGVCVLSRGTFRKVVFKSSTINELDAAGLVYSSETPVLVVAVVRVGPPFAGSHNVQVVLPDGRAGWLVCRGHALYVDSPGQLADRHDLHIVKPGLKVDLNTRAATWA